jgi:glycosyltransferase involved in cell wall biosynthesis
MYDLLHASSVVVLPWDSDLPAFPNKTFAYLEAGVPVLNEAPGELARLLGQYGAGVNSRPMEPEWLVDRIVDYVRNPSALDSMARNARRLWEERLDRKRIFLEFADHVEAIAGGPKEGAARTARPTGLAS